MKELRKNRSVEFVKLPPRVGTVLGLDFEDHYGGTPDENTIWNHRAPLFAIPKVDMWASLVAMEKLREAALDFVFVTEAVFSRNRIAVGPFIDLGLNTYFGNWFAR